jgi:hypothetical protein
MVRHTSLGILLRKYQGVLADDSAICSGGCTQTWGGSMLKVQKEGQAQWEQSPPQFPFCSLGA